MGLRRVLEDLAILALFFAAVYALTLFAVKYTPAAGELGRALEVPALRLAVLTALLPLGIILTALGVRMMYAGVARGGRVAVGMVLLILGVLSLLFMGYIVVESMGEAVESLLSRFSIPRGAPS